MAATCGRRFLTCACNRPALSWRNRRGCELCAGTLPALRRRFPACETKPPRICMPETITQPVIQSEKTRGHRKERQGEVISNKMAKTIIVRVERRFPHPKFKKVVTGYKKLYAHDEKAEAKVGDRVRIEETRPISKTKRWRLVEVVERGTEVAPIAA